MKFIVDIVILLIILITAFISKRYGFARTAVEIVGFIAILIIINSVATPVAEYFYENTVKESVMSAVKNSKDSTDKKKIENAWDSLPKIITKNSDKLNISKEKFEEKYNDNVNKGVKKAAVVTTEKLVKPLVVKIFAMIISIILFLILSCVLAFLARFINGLIKRTFLSPINSSLGFIVGIVKGLIFALIFCIILMFAYSSFNDGLWIFTKERIANSYFVKFVNSVMPNVGFLSRLIIVDI